MGKSYRECLKSFAMSGPMCVCESGLINCTSAEFLMVFTIRCSSYSKNNKKQWTNTVRRSDWFLSKTFQKLLIEKKKRILSTFDFHFVNNFLRSYFRKKRWSYKHFKRNYILELPKYSWLTICLFRSEVLTISYPWTLLIPILHREGWETYSLSFDV